MTEAEWLACEDPEPMLRFVRFGATGRLAARFARMVGRYRGARTRKLHLFAWACLYRVGQAPELECGDGEVSTLDPALVARRCCQVASNKAAASNNALRDATQGTHYNPPGSFDSINKPMPSDFAPGVRESAVIGVERMAQCALLRDIFGPAHFRPASIEPARLTSTVMTLAQQMYASRDFGAMPILADALQDAGCENEDILSHCRDANATHVRGCWVVDLVLGKE
jgi:hypothetical protein